MKRYSTLNPRMALRTYALETLEDVTDEGTFTGYGSVFNVVNAYRERILPGAFKASLREWRSKKQLPALLWQHDMRQPIGVYTDMREDDKGLYVQGQLLVGEVRQASEAHALMRKKALRGLSIGFMTRDDSYDEKEDLRSIKKLDLYEVSPVTFGADPDALIDGVRSRFTEGLPTLPEFEEFLRDSGYSKAQATAIASRGLRPLLRGEPEGTPRALSAVQVDDILKSISKTT